MRPNITATKLLPCSIWDKALAELQEPVEPEYDNASYRRGVGLTLDVLGRHKEAEAEYKKARALEKSNN